MAIKIKSLETIAKTYTEQQYIYKDLTLDLARDQTLTPGYNPGDVPKIDIKADKDYNAIRNSLTNLFNTVPGQRFLFPDYGLDLRQYLFSPITEFAARDIGSNILRCISKYEPRVNVVNVNVEASPDDHRYNITLILNFPALNTTNTVDYTFDIKGQSFILLPSTNP